MSTPADELRAAASLLRPSSPAVAAHTEWVKIRPAAAEALADWLDYHAAMSDRLHDLVDGAPDGSEHPALAVARAINARP